jgi:predicted Zn-dependent peptidase
MKFNKYFKNLSLFLLFLSGTAVFTFGQPQNFPAPRENKLLNGTKLLVWSDKTSNKAVVKIRIHSGSAFDPLGKEGVMQLLSDILFPIETTKEFFTEDLNGSFEIVTNYDYIQISASGDADKFLTIMETLSAAITNPQINKESTERVRASLRSKVQEHEKNPAYIADRAVAKRLLGNYPYGRPQLGSSESLAKIDFADLLFARERFFTADNATIAIGGNVNADLALRATKRLFGGWLKSDKKVPATFAQPDAPKADLQVLDAAAEKTSEIRFAMRGLARSDKDFYASQILANILQNRVQMREGKNSFVRVNSNILPSLVVIGASSWNVGTIKKVGSQIALPAEMNTYQNNFLKEPVKADEFEKAKSAFAEKMNKPDLLDYWLDAETYKLGSVKDDWQKYQSVTAADVQRVLEKLQKEAVASVLVVTSEKQSDNSATSNQ